jgi:hypothetical protein
VDTLPDYVLVGMLLWPNMMTDPTMIAGPYPIATCVDVTKAVGIAPLGAVGSTQRTSIASDLANATIKGGTPTHDAYLYTETDLVIPAMIAYPGDPAYVVLITDGQPTIALGCSGTGVEAAPKDSTPIIAEIANAWTTFGIHTFIIESPGSQKQSLTNADARGWLSDAAIAGQTAPPGCVTNMSDIPPILCHFDMTQSTDFAGALTAVLQSILAEVMSCSFQIPPSVQTGQAVDTSKINVIYQKAGNVNDEYLILQADPNCPIASDGSQQGWYLDMNGYVALCPTSCDMVKKDIKAVLDIRVGCGTVTVVN